MSKPRRPLLHQGYELYTFEPDIIVEGSVILELKALEHELKFSGSHYFQLIGYLKHFRIRVGYLVNFTPARVVTKRVVWDEPALKIVEEYEKIKPRLTESDRAELRQIREGVLIVARQHNLGYHETIYRKMIALELENQGLPCICPIEVPAKWDGQIIAYDKVDQLLVAERYLVHIRSLLPNPTTLDFTRTKTYLENLDLKFGLVINFGRKELQIHGVTPD